MSKIADLGLDNYTQEGEEKEGIRDVNQDIPVPEPLRPLADMIAEKFNGASEEDIVLQLPFDVEIGSGSRAKTFEIPRMNMKRERKVRQLIREKIIEHAAVLNGEPKDIAGFFASFSTDLCELFLTLLSKKDAEYCEENFNSLDMRNACDETVERVLYPLAMASLTDILGLVSKMNPDSESSQHSDQ